MDVRGRMRMIRKDNLDIYHAQKCLEKIIPRFQEAIIAS